MASALPPASLPTSMCDHDSAIRSGAPSVPGTRGRSAGRTDSIGRTTSRSEPVTSLRTASCGWTTSSAATSWAASVIVMVSTRNGMSSVTTSITSRPASSVASAPALTRTTARPCGRFAASSACSAATDPARFGPAAIRSDEFDVPVVAVQVLVAVADPDAVAELGRRLGQQRLPGGALVLRHQSHSFVDLGVPRRSTWHPLELVPKFPKQRVITQRHPAMQVGSAGRAARP